MQKIVVKCEQQNAHVLLQALQTLQFMHSPELGAFQVEDPGVAVLPWDTMSTCRHDPLRLLAQDGTGGIAALMILRFLAVNFSTQLIQIAVLRFQPPGCKLASKRGEQVGRASGTSNTTATQLNS